MRAFFRLIYSLYRLIRAKFKQLPTDPEFEQAEISAIVTQLCIDNMRTGTRTTTMDAQRECKFKGKPATYQQVDAVFRKLALVSQSFRDVIPADYVPRNFVTPNHWKVTPRRVTMTPAQIQARNKQLRDKWELERTKIARRPDVITKGGN